MRKNIFVVFLLLGICGIFYVYNNKYLRTAIFRTFVKGNCYIISEKDTLYTFGYYGVRKSIINKDNSISLINENDEFCKNTFVGHLIGRAGVVVGDYVYVTSRSYLPGNIKGKSKEFLNGQLIVFNKLTLDIVEKIDSDIRLVDISYFDNYIIVSGILGFNIYDISNPTKLNLIYRYRTSKYAEFQGIDVYVNNNKRYAVFARFCEGISIFDITDPYKPSLLKDLPITNVKYNNSYLPKGLQTFDVLVNYPYIYSSIAPVSYSFNKPNDNRGIIAYDISNIDSIKCSYVPIPKKEWYNKKTGDPGPSFISEFNDNLYVNFSEKGVAVFDVSDDLFPKYEGIIKVTENKNVIQPIHINYKGLLFAGDYYWSDIYIKNISNL